MVCITFCGRDVHSASQSWPESEAAGGPSIVWCQTSPSAKMRRLSLSLKRKGRSAEPLQEEEIHSTVIHISVPSFQDYLRRLRAYGIGSRMTASPYLSTPLLHALSLPHRPADHWYGMGGSDS